MLQQWARGSRGSFTSVVRGRYELLFLVLIVCVAVFLIADRFTVPASARTSPRTSASTTTP
ncbi:hypothetical protein GS466_05685 [Rhodococcus hoagii]|nr:hypothetical protein [Prescottella equi]